ncbi:MAG: MDR family MFS transporter [Chloroflexota bacterium]
MFERVRRTFTDFPLRFWILVGASFVDNLGRTMLFPFFALYITEKFGVGMTEAGLVSGSFSLFGLIGSFAGGAFSDKFGRKALLLFGLVVSGLSSLLMGFATSLSMIYAVSVVVGVLSSVGWPAQSAMVADMLPESQRADGFGIFRVTGNLAWIIGPSLGGLIAIRSYLPLFIMDAVLSCITGVIIYFMIAETRPQPKEGQAGESFWSTLTGYKVVALDGLFMAFIIVSILMLIVYQQMYNTLSVYLRDVHGVPARGYGLLLSIDALLVVVAQLWVTGKVKRRPPMLMMALGAGLYMIGFGMYGFVSGYALFVVAIIFITVGEMITMPVSQSLAAAFAPEAMRGRYMAVYGLTWSLPSIVGGWAAGLILDNYNPNWVWYLGGLICAVSVLGFIALHALGHTRLPQPEAETVV